MCADHIGGVETAGRLLPGGGLLPVGRLTSPNQAHYDDGHERRLRLIRALLDVGGMPLSVIAEVLGAVDDPAQPVHEVLGAAAKGITPAEREGPGEADAESAEAQEEVAELLARRGWRVGVDSPAGRSLAGVLDALRRAGHGGFVELLDVYADAAEHVAHADLDYVRRRVAREDLWRASSSARSGRPCSAPCGGSPMWTPRPVPTRPNRRRRGPRE
ncbi:MerR family transcriptional regulator [Streptomyces sp. NPDC005794]|uniref:MerR family transcriptional regulator n=1 Tax=Streptomyces sp. NPDC005794 TaxID=3364733 RepID=UPI003692825B